MVELNAKDLHWLEGGDPETDLCAHGNVQLIVGGREMETDGVYCVSAAALYLLRTLESDHNESSRVAEHLLPCCGHDMHAVEGESDVTIIGCFYGYDWYVEHNGSSTVTLSFEKDGKHVIPSANWVFSVCDFSDSVTRFYDQSGIKKPFDSYAATGYAAFRSEWSRRRKNAAVAE